MKFTLKIDRDAEEEILATVHAPSALTEQIEALVLLQTHSDRINAWREDELCTLRFADVACITVIDRRVIAIDKNGVHYRLGQRLFELQEQLPASFIRINKSTIANQAHIMRFKTTLGGGVDAHFSCGYVDYVSRRCLSEIKRRMKL